MHEILLEALSEPGRCRQIQLHPAYGGHVVAKLLSGFTSLAPDLIDLSIKFSRANPVTVLP